MGAAGTAGSARATYPVVRSAGQSKARPVLGMPTVTRPGHGCNSRRSWLCQSDIWRLEQQCILVQLIIAPQTKLVFMERLQKL